MLGKVHGLKDGIKYNELSEGTPNTHSDETPNLYFIDPSEGTSQLNQPINLSDFSTNDTGSVDLSNSTIDCTKLNATLCRSEANSVLELTDQHPEYYSGYDQLDRNFIINLQMESSNHPAVLHENIGHCDSEHQTMMLNRRDNDEDLMRNKSNVEVSSAFTTQPLFDNMAPTNKESVSHLACTSSQTFKSSPSPDNSHSLDFTGLSTNDTCRQNLNTHPPNSFGSEVVGEIPTVYLANEDTLLQHQIAPDQLGKQKQVQQMEQHTTVQNNASATDSNGSFVCNQTNVSDECISLSDYTNLEAINNLSSADIHPKHSAAIASTNSTNSAIDSTVAAASGVMNYIHHNGPMNWLEPKGNWQPPADPTCFRGTQNFPPNVETSNQWINDNSDPLKQQFDADSQIGNVPVQSMYNSLSTDSHIVTKVESNASNNMNNIHLRGGIPMDGTNFRTTQPQPWFGYNYSDLDLKTDVKNAFVGTLLLYIDYILRV